MAARGVSADRDALSSRALRLSFVLLVLLAPLAWTADGPALPSTTPVLASLPTSSYQHPREKSFLKRQWGVEVQFVRGTAAGYMLEFRYRVLDAEKAAPLFERQTKPVLTHEKTGTKLIVPTPAKTGALRNSNMPIEGRTYWMFFANPGRLVKPGDQVEIQIGKFLANGLTVK
jgi:hypothetical protein